MIADAARRITGARGPLSWATDNLTEEIIRTLQAGRIWGAMKSSAKLASGPDGGAAYAVRKAAVLLAVNPDSLEIHTIGHSAGAIFQAQLMPGLVGAGASVTTAHYLAPAIRNDEFHRRVAPLLGAKIGPLAIFTMRKQLERADTVATAY